MLVRNRRRMNKIEQNLKRVSDLTNKSERMINSLGKRPTRKKTFRVEKRLRSVKNILNKIHKDLEKLVPVVVEPVKPEPDVVVTEKTD